MWLWVGRLPRKIRNQASKTIAILAPYYGAMNCLTGEMILRSYKSANTSSTIEFVKELQSQDPEAKIVLIWDGASHHRSQKFRDFLAQTNQREESNVHCLRFAPRRVEEDVSIAPLSSETVLDSFPSHGSSVI